MTEAGIFPEAKATPSAGRFSAAINRCSTKSFLRQGLKPRCFPPKMARLKPCPSQQRLIAKLLLSN
jgi:hypothetical protein